LWYMVHVLESPSSPSHSISSSTLR
jgi:hypothetical protein